MHILKLFIASLFISLLFSIPTQAQVPDPANPENANLAVPLNWEVRLDKPDDSVTIGDDAESADIFFVNMTPGWHITTGPRAIFWHPASTARETYRASAKIHLFDPKDRNEAFGLFMGGQNLKEDNQTYTYFLLRNSGEYLIKKRIGDETETIQGWTKAPSMVIYDDTTKSSVPNTLSVEIDESEVHFFINDKHVTSLAKDQLDTNGQVGLRINHALNLHVEDFRVKKL